jgi:predicted PurR-regulated permease PerM
MHGRADLEGRTFLCLVVAVSIAFAWILWPFYGAILWAAVVAIVFTPLYRRAFPSGGEHRASPMRAAAAVVCVLRYVLVLGARQSR